MLRLFYVWFENMEICLSTACFGFGFAKALDLQRLCICKGFGFAKALDVQKKSKMLSLATQLKKSFQVVEV